MDRWLEPDRPPTATSAPEAEFESGEAPTIVAIDEHSDPFAEFASESQPEQEAVPAPREIGPPVSATETPKTRSTELAQSRRRPRRGAAVGLMAAALAAFVTGGYLYQTYPSWVPQRPRSQASVADSPAAVPPRREDAASETTAPQAKAPAAASERPSQRAAAPAPPRPEDADASPPPVEEPDSPSLSGLWSMNTRVESSRLGRYEGLRLAYQLRLQQSGDQLTGTGYKVRENERAVRTQTPITLRGEVQGDRVMLTFTEFGTRRASAGKLMLDREAADVLRGRFSSDAAQSVGVVEVRR